MNASAVVTPKIQLSLSRAGERHQLDLWPLPVLRPCQFGPNALFTRVALDLIFLSTARAGFGIGDPAGSRMFLSWRPRLHHIT